MGIVYIGIIKGFIVAGLGIFLAIALRWLPDSSRTKKLKNAVVIWALLSAIFLLSQDYLKQLMS